MCLTTSDDGLGEHALHRHLTLQETIRGAIHHAHTSSADFVEKAISTGKQISVFTGPHKTLRVTPAMEAGLADHVWSLEEIVGLVDRRDEAAA